LTVSIGYQTITLRSGATGGLGGTVPLTPLKGHFCKSSKTDEKILGVWGATSPTILEFQPEFVTSSFKRPNLTYIYPILKGVLNPNFRPFSSELKKKKIF